jgi:hypothetical protein
LIKIKDEKGGLAKNSEKIVDILLSLRANALQAPADSRRAFVDAMIKGDIFLITRAGASGLLVDLFGIPSHSIKHGLSALISILASTGKGILYLTNNLDEPTTIEKVADLLKD